MNDVHELKCNNEGLKNCTTNYTILVQDDMIVKEKNFDERMLKPFQAFNDVFSVTSFIAHNDVCIGDQISFTDSAARMYGSPRDKFIIRDIGNRGPLMFKMEDVQKLGYLDEELCPHSYDDHDISYKAYKQLGKVSGLYWIDYESRPEWGTGRQKNQDKSQRTHERNSRIIINRYRDLLTGSKHNEERILI